jgi:hypothetical protein
LTLMRRNCCKLKISGFGLGLSAGIRIKMKMKEGRKRMFPRAENGKTEA